MKKKICIITTNRSDYGRMKPVMEAIRSDPRLELQVVAGTHLFFDHFWWYLRHGEPASLVKSLPWYIKARRMALFGRKREIEEKEHLMKLLVADGFPIHARLPMFLEGGNLRVMTKTVGFCLVGMPDILERLRPDVVLMNGDRFEVLPIAFATVSSNILLAHIEGGDVSGTLDESVRHAVTKLAHIHFPATVESARRIHEMGEPPERVHVTGSPVIDTLTQLNLSLDNSIHSRYAMQGEALDFTKPFLLMLQHPVTTRYEKNYTEAKELIAAIDSLPLQKLLMTPNLDAGSDGISAALREYREKKPQGVAFYKYFAPHDFYKVFSNAAVLVGNSSSFIREGAFLGIPAVIVGDRQLSRERGINVVEVPPERDAILGALRMQVSRGRYPRDLRFGDGTAAQKIVGILSGADLGTISLQKNFHSVRDTERSRIN